MNNNGVRLTLGDRQSIELLEQSGWMLINRELHTCDRGGRKFSIGDLCELVGLEEYPELNGQTVVITNYRDGEGNGYYIKSESGDVERWLNFVWEKRLKLKEGGVLLSANKPNDCTNKHNNGPNPKCKPQQPIAEPKHPNHTALIPAGKFP